MTVFTIETPTGQKLDIEADNEEAALNGAKQWHEQNAPKGTTEDVIKSAVTGPAKAALGMAGIIPSIAGAAKNAANQYLIDPLLNATVGLPKEGPQAVPDLNQATTGALGNIESKLYQPKTVPGQYAQSVTEAGLGAAMGPGGVAMKAGQALGTGVGAQALGDYFKGGPLETWARLVGGLGGGVSAIGASKGLEALQNASAAAAGGKDIASVIGGEPLKRGAVSRVGQNVADEELTAPQAAATVNQLGPNAMVADMGPQLQGRADFMAQSPGLAQTTISKPIIARTEDIPEQLKTVLDKHMGPSQSIVELQNQIEDFSKKHVSPAYKDLEAKYPVINDPILQDLAQRPAIAQAMKNAEGVAKNYGETVSGAEPSIRYWDYVKKSLDQRINGMMRSGMDDLSSAQKADLGGLLNAKSTLVQHLDNLTGGEYAQVRRLAATKPAMQDAVEFGRGLFNNKLLPEEVAAHVNSLSIPEQRMVEIGARREIENRVGAPGDEGRKLRSLLSSPNNSAKLTGLLGSGANGEIQNAVAAADQFQQLANKIHGSQTATRLAGMRGTNAPVFNQNPTILGAVSAAPRTLINALLEHGMAGTRQDISRILTAKGGQVNPVVEALLKFNRQKTANAATPLPEQAKTLLRALISGAQ